MHKNLDGEVNFYHVEATRQYQAGDQNARQESRSIYNVNSIRDLVEYKNEDVKDNDDYSWGIPSMIGV